jgi:hypothetical protein
MSKIRYRITRGAVVAVAALALVVGAATAVSALGGSVPSQQAVTYNVPWTHITGSKTITIGSYSGEFGTFPTVAVFSGSLAARSLTGEEHVHCDLVVGIPARTIGSFDQADSGASLPSTSYPYSGVSAAGSYTALSGETLRLRCTTTGASDAIINGHVVLQRVSSEITQ